MQVLERPDTAGVSFIFILAHNNILYFMHFSPSSLPNESINPFHTRINGYYRGPLNICSNCISPIHTRLKSKCQRLISCYSHSWTHLDNCSSIHITSTLKNYTDFNSITPNKITFHFLFSLQACSVSPAHSL